MAAAILAATWMLALAPSGGAQLQREQRARVKFSPTQASAAPGTNARLEAVLSIDAGWHTNSHTPTFDYLIPTVAEFEVSSGWPVGAVTYPEAEMLPFAFVDQPIAVYEGEVAISAEVQIPANASLGNVPVAVSVNYQACNDSTCLAPVTTRAEGILVIAEARAVSSAFEPIRSSAPGAGAEAPAAAGEPSSQNPASRPPGRARSLLGMLVLALLGGLILNVMPCVLPVLSLKIFGMVKSASHGRTEVMRGGLATAAGILVSFWALAAAAFLAKGAGHAVGWGVQFQEPVFVVFLILVVLLFSLNLWGLFEIPLPARLANRVGGGGAKEGLGGHFASGLFATLMATPCSAPFLGSAVAFALSQNAAGIIAIFSALGLGMALPYLLMAVWPKAADLLPKPGAWMETLKGTMGFLLAGAAVWLFFVLGSQVTPGRLAFIQLALLALALGVWLASRREGVARPLKALAGAGALAAGIWALSLASGAEPVSASQVSESSRIAWVPFDRPQAERLAGEGTPVFVDVTANWCVTCKVVERGVLETDEVAEAFERHGVVAMKADWTNYDESIGDFLQEHGRAGIPFYLLYRPKQEPFLFSELPTKASILEALDGIS
ncbi:MAG: thioredoxin family protein [Acidobacteria bacterium]|nr:thioredoxin family protein [Acidobacteriota bacterium]